MSPTDTFMPSILATDNISYPPIEQRIKQVEKIMGPEMTRMLIQQFQAYGPQQIAALQQSLSDGDTESVRQQAHQLKGESLQIGANQLSSLCEKVERLAQQGKIEEAPANLAQIETEWAQVQAALTQVGSYD